MRLSSAHGGGTGDEVVQTLESESELWEVRRSALLVCGARDEILDLRDNDSAFVPRAYGYVCFFEAQEWYGYICYY